MKVAIIAALFSFLLAGLGHLYLAPALSRRRRQVVAIGLAVGVLLILWTWLPLMISLLVALSVGAIVAAVVPYPTPEHDWSTRGFLLLGLFAGLYLLSIRFPPAMNWNIMVVIFAAFDAYSIGIRGHGIV